MKLKIINKSTNPLPEYATKGSAGMDIRANITPEIKTEHFYSSDYDSEGNYVIIFSGGRALIPTGIFGEIPEGYEIQCRSRSGLAIKSFVFCANGVGTIDCDYRGEWMVILANLSDEPLIVNHGDRIAQIVLNKIDKIEWEVVDSLEITDRCEGGFGSTKVK